MKGRRMSGFYRSDFGAGAIPLLSKRSSGEPSLHAGVPAVVCYLQCCRYDNIAVIDYEKGHAAT